MKNALAFTYIPGPGEDIVTHISMLRQQEGCLHAHFYNPSITAHFEIADDFPREALSDGCRIVPRSIVEHLVNREGGI